MKKRTPPEPIIDGEIAYIPMTHGYKAIVNTCDLDLVKDILWYPRKAGKMVYASSRTCGIEMHRLLMGNPKGFYVDHKNQNGLDNRRENIRKCTKRQNHLNTACYSPSGYKGTCRNTSISTSGRKCVCRTWSARIQVNGKRIHLGCYPSQEDAARAYDVAAIHHFGEFACLNFPDGRGA